MKTQRSLRVAILAAGLMVLASSVYAQGRVVVSHDEWLTGPQYFPAYNDSKFIDNTLDWFGLTSGSKVLVYSGNGFLANTTLGTYLSGTRGLNVTYNAAEVAANFSQYGAILVAGNPGMNAAALAAYVFGGGHVFLEGGTGVGDAAGEAAYNNPFLTAVGLAFGSSYNGISGPLNTSSYAAQGPFGPALFTGVNYVYANNGNPVLYAVPVSGVTSQLWTVDARGVFGAAEVGVTPEPMTLLLLGTGLLGVGAVARGRRKERDAEG